MLKILGRILLCVVLTLTTQSGGMVALLSWIIAPRLHALWPTRWPRLMSTAVFAILYLFSTFLIVPKLARLVARVALPMSGDAILAPRTIWTVLLNRNYVDVELESMVRDVADDLVGKAGPKLIYLDACFPFFDGFPLLPHWSHNDGRKLDLAFCYADATGKATSDTPSFIGYGAFAQPRADEENTAARCREQGAWWYDALGVVPLDKSITLDEQRTLELVNALAADPRTGKIFIEPYLKDRWGITSNKVRFHGCHAVSHADHIHVQL